MLKLGIICSLLLLFIEILVINGYDYCKLEEQKCPKNKKHIVCHPEQMEAKAAAKHEKYKNSRVFLPMTSKVKKAIIEQHNIVRNELACGDIKDKDGENYKPAAHMRELIWDTELEYVAQAHAGLCVPVHDECRVTSKYDRVGQNLAGRVSAQEDMLRYARYFVNVWYEEYKSAQIVNVETLPSTLEIRHFTQLANDRVTRVGCAITRCNQAEKLQGRDLFKYLYTCNYSFSNILGKPTYVNSSTPASDCAFVKSVKSGKYRCLCANSDHEWLLK